MALHDIARHYDGTARIDGKYEGSLFLGSTDVPRLFPSIKRLVCLIRLLWGMHQEHT
ncbi:hypothetical protein PAXRUDRAFT_829484 [Paxillus rubicundulus Ve08.2h10]|uniref:Uncharacterized protein n=1 Tax=Paxillus rubicundulus Ve08.2h10 TaxID=930991 RepID=A0A0D0DUT6_9AGAM|nr:hypothetical protein PAXRUDRAFT_829484 [Paxillus rubicundulus Ve08.2h10]